MFQFCKAVFQERRPNKQNKVITRTGEISLVYGVKSRKVLLLHCFGEKSYFQ